MGLSVPETVKLTCGKILTGDYFNEIRWKPSVKRKYIRLSTSRPRTSDARHVGCHYLGNPYEEQRGTFESDLSLRFSPDRGVLVRGPNPGCVCQREAGNASSLCGHRRTRSLKEADGGMEGSGRASGRGGRARSSQAPPPCPVRRSGRFAGARAGATARGTERRDELIRPRAHCHTN